jgi:hypothetical protein
MTPTDVATLVESAPLPAGYRLEVTPQRRYKYRNLWSVRVFKDGDRVWGRAFYSPAHGIVAAQRWAWVDSGAAA